VCESLIERLSWATIFISCIPSKSVYRLQLQGKCAYISTMVELTFTHIYPDPMSQSEPTNPDGERARRIRRKIGRFRILVIGRANAGKTTILQKVCNTTEEPVIYSASGEKVHNMYMEIKSRHSSELIADGQIGTSVLAPSAMVDFVYLLPITS
jgi:hypothetical protein